MLANVVVLLLRVRLLNGLMYSKESSSIPINNLLKSDINKFGLNAPTVDAVPVPIADSAPPIVTLPVTFAFENITFPTPLATRRKSLLAAVV